MSYPQDPPAELRIINRQYARIADAPAANPELSLQAVNTSKLATGAMALVWNQSVGAGFTNRSIYVLDKGADPVVSATVAVFNGSGGGVWRQTPSASDTVSFTAVNYPAGIRLESIADVPLTAGAGDVVIATVTGITNISGSIWALQGIGHVQVADDGTGGSVVEVRLEQQQDGGGYIVQETRTATLLANQHLDFSMNPFILAALPTSSIDVRLVANATTQDATVIGNTNGGNQIDFQRLSK